MASATPASRLTAHGLILLALLGGGCASSKDPKSRGKGEPVPAVVSQSYDKEIREILEMARAGSWTEAETRAAQLRKEAPEDPAVARVHAWTVTEGQRRRDRALETEFRQIESMDSRFTNSVDDVVLGPDSRSLDLPRSLRGALDDVEKASDIPAPYGKTIDKPAPATAATSPVYTKMEEILSKPVSLQVDELTLEAIIFSLGKTTGVNFIADRGLPQFQRKLSVNFKDVPLSRLIDYVERQMDLHFEVGDNLVWIVDAKDQKAAFQETRFYRLSRGFVLPAQFTPEETQEVRTRENNRDVTTVNRKNPEFVRDGANEQPSIERAIKTFFTGSKYFIDYERNIIVATGTRDQLRTLENIIREFDRPIQQVLIEARFISISESAFQQLGVNWETNRPSNQARSATDYTGLGTNVGLGLQRTFSNVLDDKSLTATLNAIEQSGESQTLSAPRLTVLNNLPATIRDGKTQYFYEEYTVSQTMLENRSTSSLVPKGRPTKLTAGVSLDVLASIGGDGRSILLALKPTVSQDVDLVTFATVSDLDANGRVASTFDIKLPQSRDQEISTRVVVQSGETVVMGGVIENEQSTFTESVPVLGKLPLIGAAFRSKTEISRPRYLLIFVTATLLSESGEFIRYQAPPQSQP